MNKAIVFYLHAHQPWRLRHYTVFDAAEQHNYFDINPSDHNSNRQVLEKVAVKSYLPTIATLKQLIAKYPDFKLNLSITGLLLEQLECWAPQVLEGIRELADSGRVEFAAETYYHSLSFFYDISEFERQVRQHTEKIEQLFGQTPSVFRNTELAYNNDLAQWAERAGYKGILAEGWDPILGWRSPNFMYSPISAPNTRLLLKNYKISDDIAFRFGDRNWQEWPLTADKFAHWLNEDHDAELFNIFMDFETFGEHQWEDKGIFNFLEHLPKEWLAQPGNSFMTFSEAIDKFEPKGEIDTPTTTTWADTDRDLTAWTGNQMQQSAISAIYSLADSIMSSGDLKLIDDWRRMQTSDHFYYMCTKWFSDGDVHAYFSPYDSPYEAFINFMNVYHDLRWRTSQVGVPV